VRSAKVKKSHLNLIERFWGHLKRSAIHNYYFETVENLEKAIVQAARTTNRQKDHPLRLHLQTVRALSQAA
jgi:transposase